MSALAPEPNALALELAHLLPTRGRALDLAAGPGRLALWLARRGLHADAVDIAEQGLRRLRLSAEEAGLAQSLRLIVHDLDQGLPALEPGYQLVACLRYYAPDLMPDLRALLAPGGLLLLEMLREPAGQRRRFRVRPGEILELADGLEVLFHREGQVEGREVAQLLGRRSLEPDS